MVRKALISARMIRPRSTIPPTTAATIMTIGASFGQLTRIRKVTHLSLFSTNHYLPSPSLLL